MGLEDIAYDLIKEFRASKADKQKQIELAKLLVKKAYLRFNFEWESEKESHRLSHRIDGERQILNHYSQLFLDIAVEIYDALPDESERMKKVATQMKRGAYGTLTNTTNEITPTGDKCASDVIGYITDINK
jgi:SNF2 family DNA or RNA helicase